MFPVVILAAGEGERLRKGGVLVPKPLIPILGLTLLERSLLTWRRAGAKEFYVVVGCEGERVAAHARELARRHGLPVQVVENPHWRDGNGTSVLAMKGLISTPFFVSMVDHLFEPFSILERFALRVQGEKETVVAVDPRIGQVFDPSDATKVRLDGDRVVEAGKEILPYHAVDMGLFLCQEGIYQALEEAWGEGDGSLTGGVKRLAARGKIKAITLEEGFWVDVDTLEGLKYAKKGLLTCVARSREEGWVSHYLNRHLSQWITARLASTSITPNRITFLAFALAVAAGCLFALGRLGTNILAALLVQGASVVDGCDGEVARLKFLATPWGAWWDTLLDRYADGIIALGITWGYSHSHSGAWPWILGFISLLAFVMVSYAKKEHALRFGDTLPLDVWDKLTRRDLRLFAIFIGGLLNRPFAFMVALAALSHLWIGWVLWRRHE